MTTEYLVTGGAGFIGSSIVRSLAKSGHAVRVIDNFSTGRRENLSAAEGAVELIEGDIRDAELIGKAVRGIRYVIHTAALPSVVRSVADPLSTNSVNVCGTLKLLIAARDAGVDRFVFSSSSSVYGDTPTLPKREDMTPSPRSPYALSKLAGEHYCRMFCDLYGLKTFSLRYFNVFGPMQDPNSQYAAVIPLFVTALLSKQSPVIHGDGEQTRDFTYVDDVVEANLRCVSAPATSAGCVCNVGGGGRRVSINELAARLAEILGSKIKPIHDAARKGDVRDSQADTSEAARLLNWVPRTSFEVGLRRTAEWFAKGA